MGDLDRNILPTERAISVLANMLSKWDGKSNLDLIWGPEFNVEVLEISSNDLQVVASSDIELVQEGNILKIIHKEDNADRFKKICEAKLS